MFDSVGKILEEVERTGRSFWEVVLDDDCSERGATREESLASMRKIWEAMKQADAGYDGKIRSASGLVGTDGQKYAEARKMGGTLCGPFMGSVIEKALKMGESNACMKRIVAAPTAGACGVVPAVFLSLRDQYGIDDETMVRALYVAGGIGGVIALRASLSGAAGGCQAEIGSASSMAAAGAVFLRGGTARQIADAAAIALSNLMGLVCDPVAGLVEVPCIKRNVIGAVGAAAAADLVLAGISSVIPADEVFDAMRKVGNSLSDDVRETGRGGLAGTPTGLEIAARIAGRKNHE
ncbi:MAG: L-serine ammonia-lyase, iron-sulfur-dependent, subunit alpha [Lachnospiraceae bacterium]|jgi:L-serine dehydratase